MKRSRKRSRSLSYIAAFLLILACQIASPTSPPTLTIPAHPTETSSPTATPLPTNTSTPEPTQAPTEMPTATSEPLLSDEIYRSPEGGFSIQLPVAWKLIEEVGQTYLAAPDERSATGPRIVLMGASLDTPTSLEDFLNSILAQAFDGGFPEGDEYMTGETTELSIGGVPALGIQFTGPFAGPDEDEITIYVTVALPNDHQSFVIVAFATSERWNDDVGLIYAALRENVTFFDLNEE